MHNSSLVAIAQ